jgi:type III restriction enzyme
VSGLTQPELRVALRRFFPAALRNHNRLKIVKFVGVYGFNPCFVLELTATPQDVQPRGGRNPRDGRYANLLVEITGRELDREGMIKMPLNLDPRQGNDWKATLNAALAKLEALSAEASRLQAETGRYVRPIMLIQVERTGADQRESGHIHADDVKDWLLTAGFDSAEVAIKTAQQNDLSAPENQDLLSPTNRVRAIITKQALQEGWDCPFAYVLCSLAASANLKAMMQLVGRILRQPGALKIGVEALDECYVITHHANTADVVSAIKEGLEQDGLGDLVLRISQDDKAANGKASRTIKRRAAFNSTDIYLPKVMLVAGDRVRDLDYETDVLALIDWRGFDPVDLASRVPESAQAAESQLQRIRLSDNGDELFVGETVAPNSETLTFDPAHAVRMISDIVLNPFVGREIVAATVRHLRARGFDDAKLGQLASLIVEELRKGLDEARNTEAEALFKAQVEAGRIQFRLRMDGRNWRMPFSLETSEPENARQLVNRTGGPLERSLFSPIYESELNSDGRDVAVYLDGDEALTWWHRNVARTQYGIQGWKKSKIYPDFIFAVHREGENKRITILEPRAISSTTLIRPTSGRLWISCLGISSGMTQSRLASCSL